MRTPASISFVIPLLAVSCAENNLATAPLQTDKGALHPNNVASNAITVCANAPSETSSMVTLHIPSATTLLTNAPCPSTGGCVEHGGKALPAVSSSSTATLYDVNLDQSTWQTLGSSTWQTNGSTQDQILLHINLDDHNMKFIIQNGDTSYSVRGGSASGTMFQCRTDPTASSTYVDVLVNEQISGPPGFLNIGINVNESNGSYTAFLPIILDPNVPNNG